MALTRSLILYSGSDSSPVVDYTDDTDWTRVELGATANLGEASAGEWVIRDEAGTIPDFTAAQRVLYAHNVVVVTVGSNTLFRGRVAEQQQARGVQKAGRATERAITLEDANSHLRGIVVHNWVRGAETDAARVQGLVASYLSGSPRVTTNLNGSNLVITGSNLISLPAKTYSGVTPFEIMSELASNADKEFFVTVDNELAYFGHDYTGYASQLRISDDLADANSTTYAPWNPRGTYAERQRLSRLRYYYGTDVVQSSGQRSSPYEESIADYWEEVFWDSESVTAAQAGTRAGKILDYRKQDDVSYSLSIGPLTGDEIYKVKPGHTILFKSRPARSGRYASGVFIGDSFMTTRVRELRWTTPNEDQYIAHLQLERARRTGPTGKGNQALATQPKPNPTTQPVSPSDTLLKFYDANDGGDAINWVGSLANQAGGAEGSGFYYFKSSAPDNFQVSFAASAGTTYRITGYTTLPVSGTLRVAWRNDAAGSTGALLDSNPVIIRIDTLATGATSRWTSFEQELLAPVGTTSMSLGRSTSGSFDRIRIYTVAAADVGAGSDATAAETNYGQTPTSGTSFDYSRADHTHGTPPLPPRTVIDVLTNNSGSNIDWGDVVVQDSSMDDAFKTNTTLNFSGGWVGVAQSPIGSNASGPIMLQGYTPVINVGSNSTTRGHFLFGSNMARRAYGSATRTTGAFGQTLTTSVAPDAIIWSTTDGSGGAGGSVATDSIWDAAGDLAVGTGADTAARLAIGASNTHLISDGATALWRSNTFGIVEASSALASGTGDVTTTASLADVTGATLSLEAGTYIIHGTFDVLVNNVANDRTWEGHLDSGGSDQNDYGILVAPGLVNVRATVSQSWRLVLASTTTVKLRTLHSGGTVGDFTVKSTNTTIAAYRAGGAAAVGASSIIRYTAGNITVSSTTAGAALGGVGNLTIAAAAGDVIQVGVTLRSATSSANSCRLDIASIVSAAAVNYLSSGSGTPASTGISGWLQFASSVINGVGGSVLYVVQAGDISGGNVVLGLRAWLSGAGNRDIEASSGGPLQFWVKNLLQ